MPGPLDHLTPWIGESEREASLRREEDREYKQEREKRTAEHGPKRSSIDLQGFMQAVSEADAGGRASD